MTDLRPAIITAGYNALLKQNHPDRFPDGERARQDEVCKRLAVARDALLSALQVPNTPAPKPQSPAPARPGATASMVIDRIPEPSDLIDLGMLLIDEFIAQPLRKRAKRARARRTR